MFLHTAQAVFYYLAAASIVSALLAVTRRNPVHSMLWVLALFLHVAGIFLLLGAEFLAAVQVIVYAGAILIFYLFVVMLLDLPGETAGARFGKHWPAAAAVGLAFAAIVWIGRVDAPGEVASSSVDAIETELTEAEEAPSIGEVREIGKALFGPFAFPFEVTSLILLAAIVGAVTLARNKAVRS